MLEVKNLSVKYNEHLVLQDINLMFEPGKLYTVIGKNGSGKSTLLKTCSGLVKTDMGDILVNNKSLETYSHNERARTLSYLSQSRNTPNITVERLLSHARFPHLTYPKKLRQTDWDIIYSALKMMNAVSFSKKSLHELSGGERQRVYLAMQLAQDTTIMLLDEPTTYLDIEYQLILMELLQKMKEQERTIIMVLHDLQQALQYSDYLIVIDKGQLIDTGKPNEILNNGILKKVFHVDVKKNEYLITI